MFINPKTAIEKGWITGLANPEKQIQPNAIDFTADKAFTVAIEYAYVSEEGKQMRGSEPAALTKSSMTWSPEPPEWKDWWAIPGRDMLDFLSDVYVDLPEGVAAQLVIRSTLARNGLILTSGLYDSGFKGHIGFLLHNLHSQPAFIAPGTRVGQIIFVRSDSAGAYAGGYNHKKGTSLEYQDDKDLKVGITSVAGVMKK